MTMTEQELLAGFEQGTLPAARFRHQQHVHVAWMFVVRDGMPHALDRYSRALKRFAEANGVPGLYHQTITWAYLLIIAERQARAPAATWPEFAAANPDLLTWRPSLLDRYYAADTLSSPLAREAFLMPDRLR
jgi:hypothetical protein